jgi:hypothetical protein
VIELSFAYKKKDEVAAADDRSDLFERRLAAPADAQIYLRV